MDYGKLVAKTAYIEERRDSRLIQMQAGEQAGPRFLAWKSLLDVVPDKPVFANRLRYAAMTEEEALLLCGEASLAPEAPLPGWTRYIQAVLSELPAESREDDLWKRTSMNQQEVNLVGPIEALLPFVIRAEHLLKEGITGNGDSTAQLEFGVPWGDLSEILLHRLYQICAQTFNAYARKLSLTFQIKGEDSDALWKQVGDKLLSGEWAALLEEYPVLARKIGTAIDYFLDFILEFLTRFQEQKEALATEFFKQSSTPPQPITPQPILAIENLQGEISDLHQKGKSVLLLTLDGGRKLVYKPRSLQIDLAWERFTAQFQTEQSSIKAPHVLDCGSYGFIEFITPEPCKDHRELETYYYNAGALIALIHAFGGNDFHLENLIASGTSPVIVDTETLMIPVARYFGDGGKDDAAKDNETLEGQSLEDILQKSVLFSGFLPFWQKTSDNKREDYGALTGEKTGMYNLPVLDEVAYPANGFDTHILSGFRDMYRKLMTRKQEILAGEHGIGLFSGCKFRMLIRSSQVYGNLLQHILQPGLLKDGFDHSMKSERLVNAFLYEAHPDIMGELLQVFLSEKRALERGDLPIFYNEPDGEGILDETGMLFDRYFRKSALQNARERISGLNEDDLAIQLQVIEKSLAAESRDLHDYRVAEESDSSDVDRDLISDEKLLSDEELLKEAEQIYHELMEHRFSGRNGDYSWLSEQYDLMRGGTSLGCMGASLYDGLLGIGVFSAALYRVTGNRDALKTARHCLKKSADYLELILPNMERYQLPLGYSNGISGYLAGLSLIAEYLEGAGESAHGAESAAWEARELQKNIIKRITQKMVVSDRVLDVLGGISGLAFSLTSDPYLLQGQDTAEKVREILDWCGTHLLSQQTVTADGRKVWPSQEAHKTLTGLGHGTSGIAMALLRLYQASGDPRYYEAAREAIRYEDAVFDEKAANWPDFRKDFRDPAPTSHKFMAGYCAGAPGTGLARLDGLARVDAQDPLSADLLRDIKRSDAFVASMEGESRNHLCCGTAGRVDYLIEKARRQQDPEALAHSRRLLSELIHGKRQRGHYNFHAVKGKYYYNPTLFQGTTGIGYEILRLLAPDRIRSVLI